MEDYEAERRALGERLKNKPHQRIEATEALVAPHGKRMALLEHLRKRATDEYREVLKGYEE